METGFQGTFVISWSQTELDGFQSASLSSLRVGATWRWTGDALCVDGPQDVLRLGDAHGKDEMRRRAARRVRKLVGTALKDTSNPLPDLPQSLMQDSRFVVSDGLNSYVVTLIDNGRRTRPLLMFLGDIPPRDTELWVVHFTAPSHFTDPERADRGVICFTPGTLIDTPDGARPVECLHAGDKVQTKDNGAQEVLWTGARHMSGARLYAMPKLRPVRVFANALGASLPEAPMLVSPEHRLLLKGAEIDALFNTSEVLISARALIDLQAAEVDLTARAVTYVHLLLPQHEILFANGVETESFHPASAQLSTLDADDRAALLNGMPEIEDHPESYGSFARRILTDSESHLLTHRVA